MTALDDDHSPVGADEPQVALRAEVQELRTAVEKLHGRMDALEKRIDRDDR